jgi:nucleoside-diphosphate-sugar epimerase
MSKIICTGGTGFLGKHVQMAFRPYNSLGGGEHDVFPVGSKAYDLTVCKHVVEMFLKHEPDVVVHMAAVCGGILANKNSPATFLVDNLKMSTNIFECARYFGVKKIYTLGSVCMYPENCPVPFKEGDIFNGYPEPTNAPYGLSKRALMVMGQTHREQYGIGGAHLIPVNMYGECFSKDTTLATPIGFKSVADFKEGDEIYTLNPSTHEIEVEKVVATQRKKASKFVNLKGSIVDIRVTPEHKIYYKTNKTFLKRKAEWFIPRAGKKHGMIRFAKSNGMKKGTNFETTSSYYHLNKWVDSDHEIAGRGTNLGFKVRDHKHSSSHWIPTMYDAMDFYQFLGWYVSEGSVNSDKTNQISISQSLSNKHHRAEIEALFKRMGLPIQYDDHRFYFSSRLWKNFIESEIGKSSCNKKVPERYLRTSKALLEVLFDALMKGDGNKSGSRYSTKSDTLKDQIILIATLTGRQVGKVCKDNGCWRIPFRKYKSSAVKYKNLSVEDVEPEDVFCVTTERNHIVYAKRNDKCVWIGQCDHFDLTNSHVIPALIRKFIDAKESGSNVVECWGTGEATREFLYVEDAAKAIVKAVVTDFDTDLPINLGTGVDISIKDLATLIGELVDFDGEIVFTGEVSDGQPKRRLNVDRAKNLLGFSAEVGLKNGLIRTIDWYKKR